MAQLAVAWVLQNDNVACAITGGSRPEQVSDNVAAAGHRLSEETMTAMDAALGDTVVDDPDPGVEDFAEIPAVLSQFEIPVSWSGR